MKARLTPRDGQPFHVTIPDSPPDVVVHDARTYVFRHRPALSGADVAVYTETAPFAPQTSAVVG